MSDVTAMYCIGMYNLPMNSNTPADAQHFPFVMVCLTLSSLLGGVK